MGREGGSVLLKHKKPYLLSIKHITKHSLMAQTTPDASFGPVLIFFDVERGTSMSIPTITKLI
jgi:hypothetical protein